MRIKHSKGNDNFEPIDKDNVRMYFCGPTVYDRVHIGNIRSFLSADLIFRVLQTKFKKVTFVRNITDIDDKIINKVNEEQRDFNEFIDEKINLFHSDLQSLNLLSPTIEPRATEHLQEMFIMIETLIDRGFAYVVNGSVYFSVDKYPEGIKLFNRESSDRLSRVSNDEKKNEADFALWKSYEGEYVWNSPWGKGRPGWHIECSAMAKKYLGEYFDIHGGGIDLQFPHHTNENTQSVCSSHNCKTEMAKYWVHTKMLNINGKKMSKSEGSKIYISDLLKDYSANIIKLYFFTTKYNEDFDFNFDHLKSFNRNILKVLYKIKNTTRENVLDYHMEKGLDYLYDDFNVYSLMTYISSLSNGSNYDRNIAIKLLEIIGIDIDQIEEIKSPLSEYTINKMIGIRTYYRNNKNWDESDKIRAYLLENKIIIEDTKTGTDWYYGENI